MISLKIERKKNAIRNMKWGYIYRITNMVLPFIFRTVMIKVMGAEYLGINSLFTSILQVLNLTELGFGSAIIYSLYKPIAEDDDSAICALLSFYRKVYRIIGTVIMTAGIILLPFIPKLITGTYPADINIYFVYFLFLLNTAVSYFLFAYRGSLLNAFQRNDIESIIATVVSVFRYVVEIIVIVATREYYFYLFIALAATVLNNILKYWTTQKMFPKYKCRGEIAKAQKQEIRKNVFALMCHKIGGTILNSADNIVLSAFMGVVIVAKYGNYYYIMNAIESIIIICFTGMTAGIGNSFVTETVEKNRNDFKKVLFFNAWLVGWCSTCLLCLYQPFMDIWVGPAYMLDNGIVILIVLYFFSHCIRRTIIVFRDGAGMWQDNKWQPIVSASFNIVVNILLVKTIGLYGIIISSVLSMILIDIPWETMAFCKRIGMKSLEYIFLLAKYFVITCFAMTITYLISIQVGIDGVVGLGIKGIICILIPNILFYCIFRKNPNFSYFSNIVFKRIKRWS